jgi:hypothetical protein
MARRKISRISRAVAVDGGNEDVARGVAAGLHDQLGEVGFESRDPGVGQSVAQADLLGESWT